jgi:hypothetical protein
MMMMIMMIMGSTRNRAFISVVYNDKNPTPQKGIRKNEKETEEGI